MVEYLRLQRDAAQFEKNALDKTNPDEDPIVVPRLLLSPNSIIFSSRQVRRVTTTTVYLSPMQIGSFDRASSTRWSFILDEGRIDLLAVKAKSASTRPRSWDSTALPQSSFYEHPGRYLGPRVVRVTYRMLANSPVSPTVADMSRYAMNGEHFPIRAPDDQSTSKEAQVFVKNMLESGSSTRPSAMSAQRDPWMTLDLIAQGFTDREQV
ncbi:hypothetical protein ACHAQH_001503 [Verticillium albo-atrum]